VAELSAEAYAAAVDAVHRVSCSIPTCQATSYARDALDAALPIIIADIEDWKPGRWWSVLGPDGVVWCVTSNEKEARSAMRPGDKLQREFVHNGSEWRDVPT